MQIGNAIEVKNVTKSFKVYFDKGSQLKERLLFSKRNRYEERRVLDNVSFSVKKGEAIGLIGNNGCGKSTTLKLLTKIIYPDSGSIELSGRVSSLIELGAGFHPDMSGRENIYTNAAIFGLTRKEIDDRLEKIISFSELGEYIDNPVRTYSSGMYMRLAFSVAINVDADILLIDEILAVGDARFQAKCFKKLQEIKAAGTTIVIVSHSTDQVEQICDRTIWIRKGKIAGNGETGEVIQEYMEWIMDDEISAEEVVEEKFEDNISETEDKPIDVSEVNKRFIIKKLQTEEQIAEWDEKKMGFVAKVLRQVFRNAHSVDVKMAADDLFEALENATIKNKYIVIYESMCDYGTVQVIFRFLDKYRKAISFYYTDMSYPNGCTYIRMLKTTGLSVEDGNLKKRSLYNEYYYMNDCGGYDVFEQSKGTRLDGRMQDIYNLVKPQKGDKILDIGCGRGELAYALATSGAEVVGVDSSEDAIQIAKKTYKEKKVKLKYLCEDIGNIKRMSNYNKVVMANVIEHMEQKDLEKVLAKLAKTLQNGVLVIHTAPNRDYYEYQYPLLRKKAAELGAFLPENPKGYYEELMVENEQSPAQLEQTLKSYFKYVKVWTGSILDMVVDKSFEESCRDNQIYAYVTNDKAKMENAIAELLTEPVYENCHVEIDAKDITVSGKAEEVTILASVTNCGIENLTTRRKHPIYMSYHICDKKGDILMHDGARSPIDTIIRQYENKEVPVKIKVPKAAGPYRVCITLVAEGLFWFDADGKNCKMVRLKRKR